MKSRIRRFSSSSMRSSSSSSSTFSAGFYLKPGALAQLRNSKITAKSKAKENWNQTQIFLCQLKNPSSEFLPLPPSTATMEAFPCFSLSFKNHRPPRCLHRKKLIAVTPVFSES